MSSTAPATRTRDELTVDVLELEALERAQGHARMEPWLRHYLSHLFTEEPGTFHREIFADVEALLWKTPLQRGEGPARVGAEDQEPAPAPAELFDAAAYAYPRGHGKTTILAIGLALWTIYEWRTMPHFQGEPPFILIVSDTIDQARDRLLDLRDELETNRLLRRHYGPKTPPRSKRITGAGDDDDEEDLPPGTFKWTETDFMTRDGVRVKAVGSGSKVRGLLRKGRRPTLILCDDLENDEHVATGGQRRKLERWLMKSLVPTGLEGRLLTLVIGTILHADSLLSKLVKGEQYPGWLGRRYAAAWDAGGLPSADGPHVLWPAVWPLDRLLARRRMIGSVAFAQEYLNVPVDESTTLFPRVWLEAALARGKGTPFLYGPAPTLNWSQVTGAWDLTSHGADFVQLVVTSWDVALVEDEEQARERDTDYTAGITLTLTLDDRIQVRRLWRRRGLTPAQVRGRVLSEQAAIGADYVVLENNTATKAHEIDLRGVPDPAPGREGLPLPLKGHTTDRKKHHVYEGVPGLSILLEHGRLDLCWRRTEERERLATLIDELHGLGQEAHDDTVMALWIGVTMIRRWMRIRDSHRRKLIGPPPATYQDPFPLREPNRRAA